MPKGKYNANRANYYTRSRAALYASAGASRAARYIGNWYRSSKSNRRAIVARKRTAIKSGIGITTQHDESRVYSKRSMPYRKKKQWKMFKNKVLAVSEKELGTRQVLFNSACTNANTTDAFHNVFDLYLYSHTSSNGRGNDLKNISTWENTSDPTAAAGVNVDNSTKYIFKSAILDVTIRNASTFKQSEQENLNAAARMEVDVYEITMPTEAEASTTNYGSISDIFDTNNSETKIIGDRSGADISKIFRLARGSTPFDYSYALSRYRYKILKKTKYMLNNGESFTYQIRDPKRRTTTLKEINQDNGFNKPGWTRIVYIVSKLVPGLPVGTTNNTYQEVVNFGVTRKYVYKIEGVNDDRTLYKTQTS